MSKKKKSWSEKLMDSRDLPKVVKISGKMSKRWGEGTVVIPAPMEVNAFMKRVPKGKLVTINEIRSALARKHNATIGCPMTTAIFAWIAANAAEEQRLAGKKDITPYWRILKKGAVINPKYPGGIERQKKLLEEEGHIVANKRGKMVVVDYKKSLIKL